MWAVFCRVKYKNRAEIYFIAVQLGYKAFICMQAEKYYDVVCSNVMFLGESKNGHIIIIKLSIMQIKL